MWTPTWLWRHIVHSFEKFPGQNILPFQDRHVFQSSAVGFARFRVERTEEGGRGLPDTTSLFSDHLISWPTLEGMCEFWEIPKDARQSYMSWAVHLLYGLPETVYGRGFAP